MSECNYTKMGKAYIYIQIGAQPHMRFQKIKLIINEKRKERRLLIYLTG